MNNNEYYKEWYQQNKKNHLEHMKEKITCDICNVELARVNMYEHKKSQKHIKNHLEHMKEKIRCDVCNVERTKSQKHIKMVEENKISKEEMIELYKKIKDLDLKIFDYYLSSIQNNNMTVGKLKNFIKNITYYKKKRNQVN